jgi:hypothetical protein
MHEWEFGQCGRDSQVRWEICCEYTCESCVPHWESINKVNS